jgi:8-oxo-dGTP pyrophosphatase MutT (NUDIX family)
MRPESVPAVLHIAAAIIRDEQGRFLLVRKRGTSMFMQAGGKIEGGEAPIAALQRELNEELGLSIDVDDVRYLGAFEAEAANEPGHVVRADLFELFLSQAVAPAAEIEEMIWVSPSDSPVPPLAPLTRKHVLRLG